MSNCAVYFSVLFHTPGAEVGWGWQDVQGSFCSLLVTRIHTLGCRVGGHAVQDSIYCLPLHLHNQRYILDAHFTYFKLSEYEDISIIIIILF